MKDWTLERRRTDTSRSTRLAGGRLFQVTTSLFLLAPILFLASASTAWAQPEVDLHNLTWFVHIDLIDAGVGEDLAYWQGVLDETTATANLLLEGKQGPSDEACCTRLGRSVSVTTFGTPGDGLDFVDSAAKQTSIANTGGGGSRAFLVDSATYCSGSAPGAIGCAVRPSCSGNPNDDPALWMYVTVEALDDGTLSSVVAHERGHNACLPHVATNKCQLMQGSVLTPGLGGCLVASECTNYRGARTETSSGLECGCHDDSNGLIADGAICTDVFGGVCSGGVCGSITGDAAVRLIASADPGDAGLGPEDALQLSGLSGNWENLGQISGTADDFRAMAYARDSETLYGVVPTVGDDSIVTIDPTTGALIAIVGSIGNGSSEIVSMAYDPGATASSADDRLIVLQVTTGNTGVFRSISPGSPSTATTLGALGLTPASLFSGMAYDSIQDTLFLASPFGPHGLWETDLSSCPPSPCTTSQVSAPGTYFRDNASLSYSRETGMLYLIGDSFMAPDTRTFYDVIDPTTGQGVSTLSLDRFTSGGLAAVPEPGLLTGLAAGLLGLAWSARRREGRPGRIPS